MGPICPTMTGSVMVVSNITMGKVDISFMISHTLWRFDCLVANPKYDSGKSLFKSIDQEVDLSWLKRRLIPIQMLQFISVCRTQPNRWIILDSYCMTIKTCAHGNFFSRTRSSVNALQITLSLVIGFENCWLCKFESSLPYKYDMSCVYSLKLYLNGSSWFRIIDMGKL